MAQPDNIPPETISPLLPIPLPLAKQRLIWPRLPGSSTALALVEAARHHPGPLFVLLADTRRLHQLADEIRFYQSPPLPLLLYPDWECLPYDAISPHPGIVSQRLATLHQLPNLQQGIVLTTISTAFHRTPPRQYIDAYCLSLRVGDELDIVNFRQQLQNSGYTAVTQVMEPGEYAVRGGLLDLFPVGSNQPFRVDLFDREIESIRLFNAESQRSLKSIQHIELLPAKEFPLNEDGIKHFRQKFRAEFEGDPQLVSMYKQISDGFAPAGTEYYLSLFFENTATILDFLHDDTLFVFDADCITASECFQIDTAERYEQLRYDKQRPILPPEALFITLNDIAKRLNQNASIVLQECNPETAISHTILDEANKTRPLTVKSPPDLKIDQKSVHPYQKLVDFIASNRQRCLLVAESPGRRETLISILAEYDLIPIKVNNFHDFLNGHSQFAIIVARLDKGLVLTDAKLTIITESQLYGERAQQQRRRQKRNRDSEFVIRNLAEMHIGDPVVHEEHGVGRYFGLEKIDVGDGATEFMVLQYAGGDKLYLPVVSLHLVSRYSGASPESTPLHKLGGETWSKAKKKAHEKAHDTAVELLEIAALREARNGIVYKLDTEEYNAFVNNFPFEETPDQEQTIEEILDDMQSANPMDRLVCGDVGFGKTEVALRAAFVAAQNGKQVAILVPTTLLAQQHFRNFSDRFADLVISVALLSRFKSKKEQQKTLDDLKNGKIDIVIGTHRLLQEDIGFENLGLVIIDEEHRFGVRQKELLKKMRSKVDILTLTATPIPRTLNMALADLRKISIIATPPQERMSIKTFVSEWNGGLLREACLREIRRGGQIYWLYNDVQRMPQMLEKLEGLVPEADIQMAHGQMPEKKLERIMLDFYHQRFHILLCSTIIESGIDIPTANTIIIERADKFGLAQLHQLRGRVGRSHHQAYAYLIIPPYKTLTNDAQKRIDAITSLEELGSGFTLASHDLEIRGAGELLGESQTGEIDEVGFTMYLELLQKAVHAIRPQDGENEDMQHHVQADINIHAPALLTDDYLPDVQLRLMLYKRIASAGDHNELIELKEEIIDRFGLLPEPSQLLFKVTDLKVRCHPFDIKKIDAGNKGIRIDFDDNPNINADLLLRLIQNETDTYRLEGPNRLNIIGQRSDVEERIQAINRFLQVLESDSP